MQTPPQPNGGSGTQQGRRYPPPPPPGPSGPYGQPSGPSVYGYPPSTAAPAKPSAYWPLSIVAVLCSLVIGGIGLYFSAQVSTRWDNGDVQGAKKASTTALVLDVVGIVIGLIVILAAVSASESTVYYY
ncbi:CD225/dispanin family protein [Geodermatophilus maliterrae]|uniref:CD225/dispanin family protein n=1 Tax=Geodermatophilus maliterrae TaxID=3162531 RepID=A0ABV3XEK3_9ACTN